MDILGIPNNPRLGFAQSAKALTGIKNGNKGTKMHTIQKLKTDRAWKANYRSKAKEYNNDYRQRLRVRLLTIYGNGKCACVKCGFTDIRALSVDHIDGGGEQERHRYGKSGNAFYELLKKHNFPKGYQTLCMNCQFIKMHEEKEQNKHSIKDNTAKSPTLL